VSKSDKFSYKSAAVPVGAVFVAAGEALLVFPSAAVAESSLPALDVLEGLHPLVFGIGGEPYCIGCEGDRVRVERTGGSSRPDELKPLLLRHLEACEDPADATQSLEEIVAIAWSIERDFQVRCGQSGNRIGLRIPVWSYCAGAIALGAIWHFGFR
jgi:hypothetical protein